MPKEKGSKKKGKSSAKSSKDSKGTRGSKTESKSKEPKESEAPAPEAKPETTAPPCAIHKLPVQSYCLTCERPVCETCKTTTHYGPEHAVVGIQEAFLSQATGLKRTVHTQLRVRKNDILTRHADVQLAIERVQEARATIERGARADLDAVLQRLRKAESIKLASCNEDIALLKKELAEVDTMEVDVNKLLEGTDYYSSLQKIPQMTKAIAGLLGRDLEEFMDGDRPAEADLPDEVSLRRDICEKFAATTSMLHLKSQLLETADERRQEVTQDAAEELGRWEALTGEYEAELARYRMRCVFCSIEMGPDAVNTVCPENQDITVMAPAGVPDEVVGGMHHYWAPSV